MDFLTLKSLHIIFIVTWFAGLFYMPRLLIYMTEVLQKSEPERSIIHSQLSQMANKLWHIITWPSCLITLILGTAMILKQPHWLDAFYFKLKLFFVALLFIYHLSLHFINVNLQKKIAKYSSTQLRLWNEVATILLVSIVFLIVKKDEFSWIYGTIGIILFAITLFLAVNIYKKIRNQNKK